MAYRKTKQLREFEPILLQNGYRFTRCKGSHFIYMNRTSHKIIAVKDCIEQDKMTLMHTQEDLIIELLETVQG